MKLQEMIYTTIFNEPNLKILIDRLNRDINVPIISEKTEEKILEHIIHHFKVIVHDSLFK